MANDHNIHALPARIVHPEDPLVVSERVAVAALGALGVSEEHRDVGLNGELGVRGKLFASACLVCRPSSVASGSSQRKPWTRSRAISSRSAKHRCSDLVPEAEVVGGEVVGVGAVVGGCGAVAERFVEHGGFGGFFCVLIDKETAVSYVFAGFVGRADEGVEHGDR